MNVFPVLSYHLVGGRYEFLLGVWVGPMRFYSIQRLEGRNIANFFIGWMEWSSVSPCCRLCQHRLHECVVNVDVRNRLPRISQNVPWDEGNKKPCDPLTYLSRWLREQTEWPLKRIHPYGMHLSMGFAYKGGWNSLSIEVDNKTATVWHHRERGFYFLGFQRLDLHTVMTLVEQEVFE